MSATTTTARNIDGIGNVRPLQEPPPELLPFLDALAELLADQIIRESQKPCNQEVLREELQIPGETSRMPAPSLGQQAEPVPQRLLPVSASIGARPTIQIDLPGAIHLTHSTSKKDAP